MTHEDNLAATVRRPTWLEAALACAPVSSQLEVENCAIHFLRWGPEKSEQPGLLFLHAGGAHARWWSFIAPFFARERPVAALDFSGMGDSGAGHTAVQRTWPRSRPSSEPPGLVSVPSWWAIVSAGSWRCATGIVTARA